MDEVVSIVHDVMKKALYICQYPVGIDEQMKMLINVLQLEDTKAKGLGMWGMGGIGKTTLARGLYNHLQHNFNSSCYLENIKDIFSQPNGNLTLQNELPNSLFNMQDQQFSNVAEGQDFLEQRLSLMNVLIVLDDVSSSTQVTRLVNLETLGYGSRIIITSRDKRVFEEVDITNIVEIHGLSTSDARKLFILHAFGRKFENIISKYDKMVDKITKSCKGHPLMIEVIGAHLKNEDNIDLWEEMLQKLDNEDSVGDRRIFDCLYLRYDALEEQQKDMFLDVACALVGTSMEKAKYMWKAKRWHVENGIRNLMAKSLIKLDAEGCVVMHDLLRDMGRAIVKAKCGRIVEKQSRIWMPDSLIVFKNEKVHFLCHVI